MADKQPQQPPDAPASNAVTPALEDKGLWVATIAAILTPLSGYLSVKLGIAIDPTSLATFTVTTIFPLITYIVMHKYKSAQVLIAEANAAAHIEATKTQAAAMQGSQQAADILNQLFASGMVPAAPASTERAAKLPEALSPSSLDRVAKAYADAQAATAKPVDDYKNGPDLVASRPPVAADKPAFVPVTPAQLMASIPGLSLEQATAMTEAMGRLVRS